MSIASKLELLQQDITAARTAITTKGGSVTTGGGSAQLATDITTIPTGGGPTGTININYNGTFNVSTFATAEVLVQNIIHCAKQVPFTVTANYYYRGGSDANPIAYNGWSITNIVDTTGYSYIAVNTGSSGLPGYTYYNGSVPTSTGIDFIYNNITYFIYQMNSSTAIGFSNISDRISNYKYFLLSEFYRVPSKIEVDT